MYSGVREETNLKQKIHVCRITKVMLKKLINNVLNGFEC